MKRYRLTASRKALLRKIGIEVRNFGLVMGVIMLLGLINGLVEMIP